MASIVTASNICEASNENELRCPCYTLCGACACRDPNQNITVPPYAYCHSQVPAEYCPDCFVCDFALECSGPIKDCVVPSYGN